VEARDRQAFERHPSPRAGPIASCLKIDASIIIAEGNGKLANADRRHFFQIARLGVAVQIGAGLPASLQRADSG